MRRKLTSRLIVLCVFGAAALAACGSDSSTSTGAALQPRDQIKIAFANVGVAGDTFFVPIRNQAEQAARDFGVEVDYRETQQFDVQEQARLLEAAIATKPDGIVTQMVDHDALGPAVEKAEEAGIPVVFMTAGSETLDRFDELTYIGAFDLATGRAGGERFKQEGVENPICINHQVGNKPLDDRCRGFEEGFGQDVDVIAIDGEDPTAASGRIQATLAQDSSIDGIFTLGNTGASAALDAVALSGQAEDITLGTVDFSKEILEAVRDGKMLFALDQQQGLQAYEAVKSLVLYNQYGYQPPSVVETGPVFVTRDDAEEVIQLQQAGWR